MLRHLLAEESAMLRSIVRLATLAPAAALLLPAGASAQTPRPRAEVVSLYQRPAGLLAKPPVRLALARPRTTSLDPEAGLKRAQQLAAALGVQLGEVERKADEAGETLSLSNDRHRLKVYLPSGMVRYRDRELFNRDAPEDLRLPPLANDKVLSLARGVVGRLAEGGLVAESEILYPAARFSSRMENAGQGAPEGPPGRRAELPKARAADFRVFLPRAIAGVPVAGHGVRLTFTPSGRLAGVDLLIREAALDRRTYPLRASASRARSSFERSLRAAAGSRVEILAQELVYLDPGPRDPAAFLEPVYQLVYRVRTPIPGRDDYRVSKVLHWELPAIRHGQRQIASPRDARLAELAKRFRGERPYATPEIRRPEPGQEEREGGEG